VTVTASQIVGRLEAQANPANVAGMARYGIKPENNLGVSMPALRAMAADVKREIAAAHPKDRPGAEAERHTLALDLWNAGVRDARMVSALVDVPALVTEEQMDAWVADLDSWDICDHVTGSLFDKTEAAYRKAAEWAARDEEFVRRAGFAMVAWLAVHDKKAPDEAFEAFLPLIERYATDERNFAKKAVNWALRCVGKRNQRLHGPALAVAERLAASQPKAARWVGKDAVRELTSEAVLARLGERG
jgi:3-methyladenine DNA glycosylase AlkD